MKINPISTDYQGIRSTKSVNAKIVHSKGELKQMPQGIGIISFKSGNKRHIAHMVAEEPLFGLKDGGVGTVSNDYNFLYNKDVDKIIKIIPMYNQEVIYKKDIDPVTGKVKAPLPQEVRVRYIPNELPSGHPFKGKEGTAFVTSKEIDKTTDLVKFLKDQKDSIFLVDEVKSANMDWGLEKDVPIKMFKARMDENLKQAMNKALYPKEAQDKLEFIFVYVDSTSSMLKPYGDGSYASAKGDELAQRFSSGWAGSPYAKFNKATVELMPALKEKYSIDPAYILCSDGQTQFTMHYAAQKNAAGDAYWAEKFFGGVGHNMNRGYTQEMGARQAIVNLGATKEQIEKLIGSKEYINASLTGEEESFLRKTVLKNFFDKKAGEMNAFMVPIHYAKAGYAPMLTTVSEGYHDSIISNNLVSPMYESLKELDKIGRFKGLTNPLMDPTVSGFTYDGLQDGYKNDVKLKLANGSEVTVPKFQIFDSNKKYDLKHVREVKRQNKINLLKRFSKNYINAQAFDSKKEEWLAADTGRMQILTGAPGRKAKIYGEISDEYIKKLESGKDVKMIVSWGRGDFQKSMDTVIDSFEKYASKDPDAVLVFGGPMNANNPEAKLTLDKFRMKMNQPGLKGRMIMMDGWTPGKDFAIAGDVALLPSRFAPCELTDLEAKKYLCTPIVPNVQGMAQKDFDPLLPEDAKLMDAYKGKHEYYMTEETALSAANEEAKSRFNSVKTKLVKEISKKYKGQLGEDISAELLNDTLLGKQEYADALRELRDSVISDEMADCLERALVKDRNSKVAEDILKHQVDADTTWFGNSWLSKTNKSSGDLYFEYHFNNKGHNINEKDLIKLDFSGLHDAGFTSGSGKTGFIKSPAFKMAAGIIAGVAALAGVGYYGYKEGWFNTKMEAKDEKKDGHLSCVS